MPPLQYKKKHLRRPLSLLRSSAIPSMLKNRRQTLLPAPAIEESVVISYGILIAKVMTNPQNTTYYEQNCFISWPKQPLQAPRWWYWRATQYGYKSKKRRKARAERKKAWDNGEKCWSNGCVPPETEFRSGRNGCPFPPERNKTSGETHRGDQAIFLPEQAEILPRQHFFITAVH